MTKIIDRLKLSVAAGILGDDPGRLLYVMEDRFAVPVGSGALNGTSADPGPSATRVVTDTASGAGVTLKYANIVFDGNSLTLGTGASAGQSYPDQVMGLLGTVANADWINIGVGGQGSTWLHRRAIGGHLTELSAGTLTANLYYQITACQTDYFYPGCQVGDLMIASSAIALDANNKVQEVRKLDAEKNTGTLTIGNWYCIINVETDHFYAGCQPGDVFQAAAATACNNLNSVANLTAATDSDPISDHRFSSIYAPNNIVVAWEIGNELAAWGVDSAYARFVTYCTARKALGYKIIALTVTPRTTTGFNVLRNSANTLMREAINPPWDVLVDLDTDPAIGADAAAADPVHYADGTHMTAHGYSHVAALVAPVLSAMLQPLKSGAVLKTKNVYGDPGLWYASQVRTAGRGLAFKTGVPRYRTGKSFIAGWSSTQNSYPTRHAINFSKGGELQLQDNAGWVSYVATLLPDTEYQFAIFPRAAAGAYYFIKGGIYTTWTLFRVSPNGTTTPLYPGFSPFDAGRVPIRFVNVFDAGQLIVPLASDTFGGTRTGLGSTDGAGHASTAGFDDGGAGVAWVAPTWDVSSGYARNASMALGSELATGSLTVGKWYIITASQTDHFYTGSAVNDTFVATAATALDANNKVKELLLYGSGAYLSLGEQNLTIITNANSNATGTASGIDFCVDSVSNPQSFLRAYWDKRTGKVFMDKYVAGVWTNVLPGVTSSALPELQLIKVGNRIRLFANTTFIGRYTITDAELVNNTICGMFCTQTANSIPYFVVYGSQASATDKVLRSFCR
jgi:hypothetical protein